ncbi:MAG: hypothetical protein JOZ54_20700 [Acidobacteria bacterium]|nr:hypothetical protein [Acidobacteriota bacterium]
MLVIRQAQLDAFRRRPGGPADPLDLANALRDLGHFDPANASHRKIVGAADAEEAMSALASFITAQRAIAARRRISHDHLFLHWCSFFFRFAPDWLAQDGVAALLADAERDESQRLQAVRDRPYARALRG